VTTDHQPRRGTRSAPRHRLRGAALATTALATAVALVPAAPALAAAPSADGPATAPTAAATAQATTLQPGLLSAVLGTVWGDRRTDDLSRNPLTGQYDARRDPGSLYSITTAIGARSVWQQTDARGAALTGKGVTVAVVDSGVSPVRGLDGKLVQGPDLSIEANSPTPLPADSFGHGTHMASIIGASDAVATSRAGSPSATDSTAQLGVAPGAGLLALKLANTDGSTDVSQVIAGLDWVVEHRDDNGMDVRVVNLSFGTSGLQDYQVDPLAAAVERAWHRGVVVVVSAGNEGKGSAGLTNPAIDPYVIAVGATSPSTSLLSSIATGATQAWSTWGSPSSASFSSRGTSARPVDVAAPGTSVVGLRAPGSFVDAEHPEGRVAADASTRLFRGSGTSQAAAVVSGAAALLLQADPTLTPDAVKAVLKATADPVWGADRRDVGAGQVDVAAALRTVKAAAAGDTRAKAVLASRQAFPKATGLGSLEAARGDAHLVDPGTGEALAGEVDVQGRPWDGRVWAAAAARDETWSGGLWLGERWSGDAWTSATGWERARWSDAAWQRARWSAAGWDSARWSRARWSSANYDSARWS
jgi:serine protease AprX